MAVILDTPVAVRRAAMDLLARREHGLVELGRKLRQRGAPENLIESELARLAEEGLLDESRYLESYISSRARAGYGPVRIREELGQRGLPRDRVVVALDEADIDWADGLREVWRRKFKSLPQTPQEQAKQARFLAYRGFSLDQIGRLFRGRLDE
ncbi:recombination regulator RecX [Pseudomonas matsuisoli]|uniref:Regulatory protein RecX n=1 Tax=Pseudomonas matsuisoli TaxID=1515666 RepID=A0A917US11_9PSED|nr:recombination regulator RecX [Pseudomonas matsuisoli]GGJ81678.1 regulatory protein RecX [Pseudomonas matsuisoli]